MSEKKPGFFGRLFGFIGKLARVARSLINILFLLIFLLIISSFFTNNLKPLPESAFLRIAPGGVLVEQKTYTDPLGQMFQQGSPADAETLVSDLTDAITAAEQDARIKGITLELNYLAGGGVTKLEQVGKALEQFKQSGKPVIALGDSFTQEQYYLASFADEIHLNPMGAVLLTGFGSYRLYFKDAIDKLKVNFHIFRAGEYKDAVEPFIATEMSPASKEHTSAWLNELWQSYTDRVETLRNLPASAIADYADNLDHKLVDAQGDAAQLALQFTLVDTLSTRPQMRAHMEALAGPGDDDQAYAYVDIGQYLLHQGLSSKPQASANKVGVITAKGVIYDGEQPEGSVGGDTLAALIVEARENEDIKALVLRVDSPGGSAFASDVIRQELRETQAAGIPVVVSMGSVAASGGYWIAAGADEIWASPTTITGSIGVFGMLPTFEESLSALGVYNDGVGTGEFSDLYQLGRPLSERANVAIQLSVEHIYREFLTLVAEGRNSTVASVDNIAQGRVWTGKRAQELGLVDKLGSLDDAVAAAATLAQLDSYEVEPVTPPLDLRQLLLKQIIENTGVSLNSNSALTQSGALPNALHWLSRLGGVRVFTAQAAALESLSDPRGIYLHCLECGGLN
ncbi:MAG: signal peptide peptidase SppA [Porticoccaceae bacterium]